MALISGGERRIVFAFLVVPRERRDLQLINCVCLKRRTEGHRSVMQPWRLCTSHCFHFPVQRLFPFGLRPFEDPCNCVIVRKLVTMRGRMWMNTRGRLEIGNEIKYLQIAVRRQDQPRHGSGKDTSVATQSHAVRDSMTRTERGDARHHGPLDR